MRVWPSLVTLVSLIVVVGGVGACSDEESGPSSPLKTGAASTSDGGASSSGATDSSAPPAAEAGAPDFNGEATYYNAEGKGACGIDTPSDYLVAAINDEQYSKANCGRCVEVTGPKGTVVVKVIDKCPGCDAGDLDLSETAFTKIANKSAGRVKIGWRFVPCP